MRFPFQKFFILLTLTSQTLWQGGCSMLFGNVKPVTEKSEKYEVMDLSAVDLDWKRMPSSNPDDPNAPESSDIAYQSRTTGAVVSLNSTCRQSYEREKQDLKKVTRTLLFGIADVDFREEKETSIESVAAFSTTVRGRLNEDPVMIRAIVSQHRNCLFDIMYVAQPTLFSAKEAEFTRFVKSLRLL